MPSAPMGFWGDGEELGFGGDGEERSSRVSLTKDTTFTILAVRCTHGHMGIAKDGALS